MPERRYTSAVYIVVAHVFVCMSACLSVTRRYCFRTANRKITQIMPHAWNWFLARDVIYSLHLALMLRCQRLSVRLSVTEVHWRIIANLGFKFRSQFTAHCGRGACGREGRDHRREEWKDHLALC